MVAVKKAQSLPFKRHLQKRNRSESLEVFRETELASESRSKEKKIDSFQAPIFQNHWKDLDSTFDETHVDIKEITVWFFQNPPSIRMEESHGAFEPMVARKQAPRESMHSEYNRRSCSQDKNLSFGRKTPLPLCST
jgi:hypothetical protein